MGLLSRDDVDSSGDGMPLISFFGSFLTDVMTHLSSDPEAG
jgi:hypothetical protein